MFYFFIGGVCGSLITAYVMYRIEKHRCTSSQPAPRCARLSSYGEESQLPYAVHVRRVALFTSPSHLTEQEERRLTFLRRLIASGVITED